MDGYPPVSPYDIHLSLAMKGYSDKIQLFIRHRCPVQRGPGVCSTTSTDPLRKVAS